MIDWNNCKSQKSLSVIIIKNDNLLSNDYFEIIENIKSWVIKKFEVKRYDVKEYENNILL